MAMKRLLVGVLLVICFLALWVRFDNDRTMLSNCRSNPPVPTVDDDTGVVHSC